MDRTTLTFFKKLAVRIQKEDLHPVGFLEKLEKYSEDEGIANVALTRNGDLLFVASRPVRLQNGLESLKEALGLKHKPFLQHGFSNGCLNQDFMYRTGSKFTDEEIEATMEEYAQNEERKVENANIMKTSTWHLVRNGDVEVKDAYFIEQYKMMTHRSCGNHDAKSPTTLVSLHPGTTCRRNPPHVAAKGRSRNRRTVAAQHNANMHWRTFTHKTKPQETNLSTPVTPATEVGSERHRSRNRRRCCRRRRRRRRCNVSCVSVTRQKNVVSPATHCVNSGMRSAWGKKMQYHRMVLAVCDMVYKDYMEGVGKKKAIQNAWEKVQECFMDVIAPPVRRDGRK